MGRGVLLGYLSGILDGFNNLLVGIFNFFAEYVVAPILSILISTVFTTIQYYLSAILYEASKFLLALIDFVEILFRALAGLPSGPQGSEIAFSINGKSGDLLIQMLTSKEVLQVFYATAIVGVFLLIITTIFSMIKVEYTTEGAQNSKTSIIGKSLKSLCNMLIIPLLCIMGVFIGNQVLDLIDTATGGGEGSKISGTLWVTAASSSMLKTPGSLDDKFGALIIGGAVTQTLPKIAIVLGAVDGFSTEIYNIFHKDNPKETLVAELGDPANRDAIEDNFAKCAEGYNYYTLRDVIKYYYPFTINYFVLIFAACIIIKCLYHTCFGLIDRLYQCTALFIVMPMVVGMSPVKDSLGGWRSKFISKALSAYGTIISLNLFFIISKILLNITITFSGTWFFPRTFMSGLIKTIMVLVGCMMIEKLAGDLGGYFGGGNAMSDGKGLANDVKGAMNTAVKAGMMAVGGVGLAKAGIGAIAGKIATKNAGKGLASDLAGAGAKASKASSAAADAMKKGNFDEGHLKEYSAFEERKTNLSNEIGNLDEAISKDDAFIESAKNEAGRLGNIVNDQSGQYSDTMKKDAKEKLAKLEADKREAEARKKENRQKKESLQTTRNKVNDQQQSYENAHKGIGNAYNLTQQANAANAEYSKAQSAMDDYNKKKQEEKEKKSEINKARLTRFSEGTQQMLKDQVTKLNPFKSAMDEYDKAADNAMGVSDEGKALNEMIKGAAKSKKSNAFEARNKRIIEERKLAATNLIVQTANTKLAEASTEATANLNKLKKALEEVGSKYSKENAKSDKDQNLLNMYLKQADSIRSQMTSLNGKIEFDGVFHTSSDLNIDFKMDKAFMDKLQAQIKKGVKMDDIMAQIKEEFKRIGLEGNDKLLNEIYKTLEDLKGKIGK